MLPPNIANYTVPGGVKLFFDDGTGERDLGNIVTIDMTPGTDELEHFSNRSGKRMKDHSLVLEEKLTIKVTLDEIVAEHWKYFFKAGDITNVGAGTATVTDQKLVLDGVLFNSLAGYYGLSAVTVRQFIDYCLLDDDSAGAFVDNSTEADTTAGTPFEGIAETADVLYFGKATPFKNLYLNLQTNGSYGARTWEYWNGSAWTAFIPTGTGEPMDADGNVDIDAGGALTGWALTTVNSIQAYWVRVSVASVTTPATILSAGRQNGALYTDYQLDVGVAGADGRRVGSVARIAAGLFEAGEEVKVTFTHTTWTSQTMVVSGAGNFIQGSARIEMHPTTGRGTRMDLEIPLCQLKPEGNISLNDKEWLQIPLTLEVLDNTTNTPTYPMGRLVVYE